MQLKRYQVGELRCGYWGMLGFVGEEGRQLQCSSQDAAVAVLRRGAEAGMLSGMKLRGLPALAPGSGAARRDVGACSWLLEQPWLPARWWAAMMCVGVCWCLSLSPPQHFVDLSSGPWEQKPLAPRLQLRSHLGAKRHRFGQLCLKILLSVPCPACALLHVLMVEVRDVPSRSCAWRCFVLQISSPFQEGWRWDPQALPQACPQPQAGCPAPSVLWAALAPGEGSLPSKRHG